MINISNMIRFHSFYPQTFGNDYSYFADESDIELKKGSVF